MRYISTRGGIAPLSFQDAVMTGLARDGGLLLPERIPQISADTLEQWQDLSYQELALKIFSLFTGGIQASQLKTMIDAAYARFSHPQITPLRQVGDFYVLELFHGPTFAFKDVALQLLGQLFSAILEKRGGYMNIIGATSGDTGSAAIAGVRGKKHINIFILHPHGRTSPIQALQMTTVLDNNVFNIAVKGDFDSAQAIVKALFNDLDFRDQYHLGAVNSINWARIMAQVVYYVFAYLILHKKGVKQVDFSVPTGNFGDIFAGYMAKRLLPDHCIETLVLATNANDLLTRFVCSGDYSRGQVVPTISPSMDIQIASNFERYLFYLHKGQADKVKADMEEFSATGKLNLAHFQKKTAQDFRSFSVSEQETLTTIAQVYREHHYLADPHTAVGIRAAWACRSAERPVICLATAHPAKFGAAVKKAIGEEPELPPSLAELAQKESRSEILDANEESVRRFVARHALRES